MKQFEVTITETFVKKIIIDAETVEEAENVADSMNFNCENCGETMTLKVKVDIEYEVCD